MFRVFWACVSLFPFLVAWWVGGGWISRIFWRLCVDSVPRARGGFYRLRWNLCRLLSMDDRAYLLVHSTRARSKCEKHEVAQGFLVFRCCRCDCDHFSDSQCLLARHRSLQILQSMQFGIVFHRCVLEVVFFVVSGYFCFHRSIGGASQPQKGKMWRGTRVSVLLGFVYANLSVHSN